MTLDVQPLAFVRNWSARTFAMELQIARRKAAEAKTPQAQIVAKLWLDTLTTEEKRREAE